MSCWCWLPPRSSACPGATRGSARSSDEPRIRNRPRAVRADARLPRLCAGPAGALLMTANGWLQIALFFVVVLALTKPLGAYMFRVFEGDRQPLPRVFGPVERFLYRSCGVDPTHDQDWKQYTLALLLFS